MRILWLEPETHVPGGGPRTSLALAAALRAEEIEVDMVASLGEASGRYDFVFSQQFSSAGASAFARASKTPFVHFLHGPRQVGVAPDADLYVFNTHHLLDRERCDVPRAARTTVVHPRVLDAVWNEQSVARHAIVTLGTGVAKGIDLVIAAARDVPDEHFVIASGNGCEKPDELPPNVIWTGPTTAPEKVYSIAKLFFLPSHVESFGLVYAEALVSGVPSIACDLPGPREALFDTGVFVPPWTKDLAPFVRATLDTLEHERNRILDARVWIADRERVELRAFLSTLGAIARERGGVCS